MKEGRLFVLAGTEGTGKTTVMKRLKEIAPPDKVAFTREPGGSVRAEEIRNFMFSPAGQELGTEARFHLVWAARADHLEKTILPAIKAGKVVVSDRFDICTYAFQVFGEEHGHLAHLFWDIRRSMLRDLRPPVYLLLDLDPEIGLARKAGAGAGERNFFDDKKLEFHRRVREGYLDFAEQYENVVRINASRPPDVVWNDVLMWWNDALR